MTRELFVMSLFSTAFPLMANNFNEKPAVGSLLSWQPIVFKTYSVILGEFKKKKKRNNSSQRSASAWTSFYNLRIKKKMTYIYITKMYLYKYKL